jgi:hypothetical protein
MKFDKSLNEKKKGIFYFISMFSLSQTFITLREREREMTGGGKEFCVAMEESQSTNLLLISQRVTNFCEIKEEAHTPPAPHTIFT